MTDETRPDHAEPDAAAFDREGQDAIEGRKPEPEGGAPAGIPPAGSHATAPLTSGAATPGTGALPSGGDRQGEVDPAID